MQEEHSAFCCIRRNGFDAEECDRRHADEEVRDYYTTR